MKSDRNPPITIEDLIRLKRAERPPVEFWAQFNQELRAKQLAALVQKHPWWQTLPSASFRALTRFRLPLGAAAVLVATFYSVRDNHAPDVTPEVYPVAISITPAEVSASLEPQLLAGASGPIQVAVTLPAASVESRGSTDVLSEPQVSTLAISPSEEPLVPIFASIESPISEAELSGSPILAVNLGSANTSGNTAGSHLLGARAGFESRVLPTRGGAVDPLQQMSSPGETRRARLMTAMVSMASMEASARTTARAASKIEEEDLYDQVQRFGARGDRLHVKF